MSLTQIVIKRVVPGRETQFIVTYGTTQLMYITEMVQTEYAAPWSVAELVGRAMSV